MLIHFLHFINRLNIDFNWSFSRVSSMWRLTEHDCLNLNGQVTHLWLYIYTLFDGLAYNTGGYFVSCVVFFPSPTGARKNMSNEENVSSYYMLNHWIRGLILHTKKIVILQLASIFLVRVFRNTLIPSVKMTLTMNRMFAGIIKLCQTIEREVDYSTAKKNCYFGFYFQ